MAFILRTGPRNLPATGNTIYVYETGTTNLVSGLTKPDTAKTPLTNPFTVTEGQWGFEPPNSSRVDVYWDEAGENLIEDVNLRDINIDLKTGAFTGLESELINGETVEILKNKLVSQSLSDGKAYLTDGTPARLVVGFASADADSGDPVNIRHGHGSIIDGFTGLEIGKLYIPDNDNPGDIKVLDLGNFYEEAHNIIGQAISAEELRLLKGVQYYRSLTTDDIGNESGVAGTDATEALDALDVKVTEAKIQDILDRYWIPEGYNGIPQKILPLAAARAYYFTAIKHTSAIFSPDGANFYKYVGCFGNGTNGTMVFSNDGKTWITETTMTGLTGAAYHAALAYDGTNLHIWYWTGTMNYTIGNVHHAISSPGLAYAFSGDAAITEVTPGQVITGPGGSNYRRGTYGKCEMNYNATATNTGTDPRDYSFWGILDVTDGSHENSVFVYSTDGLAFTRWDGNGDQPIIPTVPGTFYSYSTNQTTVFYDDELGKWIAYFQGCSSNPNNQNVGLAYADDMLDLFTVFSFPLYVKGIEEYGQRCYCPFVLDAEDGEILLYKAGRSTAGDYATFLCASSLNNRSVPLNKRPTAKQAFSHIVTAANISAKKIVFASISRPDPIGATDFNAILSILGPLRNTIDFALVLGTTIEFDWNGKDLDGVLAEGDVITFIYAF